MGVWDPKILIKEMRKNLTSEIGKNACHEKLAKKDSSKCCMTIK